MGNEVSATKNLSKNLKKLEPNNSPSPKDLYGHRKDKDEDTGKAEQARRLGVQVLTPEEVMEKYKL